MENRKLYILAGSSLLELFEKNNLIDANNTYVPFNEAMCDGPRCSGVFSESFNRLRSLAHEMSVPEYESVVLGPLRPLLYQIGEFRSIVLVFGKDMFDQINMLTILTYLAEIGYPYEIRLLIINEHTCDIVKSISVNENELYDYRALYERNIPHPSNVIMNSAMSLYQEYKKDDNEIMDEIRKNVTKPLETLSDNELTFILTKLFFKFEDYGLGDTQYVRIFKHLHQIGEI